uniref:RING-type E3 ubiquitin transferase n=1 Tax=Salarias fasciatus TaxID=181472 RepID=A0A672HTZ3_SALFA
MAGCGEKRDDAAVIIVENEAESMPVQEERSGPSPAGRLDTCPVCQLNFHSREPKLLPCLHSFCRKCLPSPSRNLATAEAPNSHADSAIKPLNVIRCPVCRQECMEVDVMDNVFLKDSAEAPSSTVEKTVQLCMTCDDNTEAAGFCVDCVEYLCATCVEAHQRVKFTKDHVIRLKTEVRSVSTHRPMFCDVHKQEPLKLFCETCDLLTCRDCQLVKHKDHNYQFLEDAYKNHKQHMESMTHQLQEKKKLIEEVSNSINNGLLQVDQNRTSVHNEIKKSVCSLILEINKKGKMLLNQLESATKDHESVLRKQQEDIGYLSRHLDHVISFTKWATARSGGTALLYCKRLILFQIGNLLRAKCSASFVPQSTVRFQCRASYWASNVDLGSLVVESVPGHQLGGFQGFPHQLSLPPQGPSGSPHSFALGGPNSTLAQLQMQVDKLNPQPHWQPQPPPPPWTWYQSVRLPRTVLGGSPSQSMPPQPGRRFMAPPPSHVSPTSSLPSPGFSPQVVLNVALIYFCCALNLRPASWKPEETHQANGSAVSAAKRRRRSSPGPIIVIKDEPDDDSSYTHASLTASLPDSTNDQLKITSQGEGKMGEEQQADQTGARSEDSNEVLCAVCRTAGHSLTCHKCLKVFHLACHVPSVLRSPSGEWLCSFCRDLLVPEMEYDCRAESKPEAKTVKMETDSEGGLCPVEKRKCERLLLLLFCTESSSDFQESASPSVSAQRKC